MKKIIIALVLLVSANTVFAQAINNVPQPQAQEAKKLKTPPEFKFLKGDVHDFGKIPEGPVATYVFEFKNVGKSPLIIQNANASCGCTIPEWPKEPILPGKKGEITVKYNTQGRGNQPFDKSIYITSNAPSEGNKPYELHIKGFVNAASSVPSDVKAKK